MSLAKPNGLMELCNFFSEPSITPKIEEEKIQFESFF